MKKSTAFAAFMFAASCALAESVKVTGRPHVLRRLQSRRDNRT